MKSLGGWMMVAAGVLGWPSWSPAQSNGAPRIALGPPASSTGEVAAAASAPVASVAPGMPNDPVPERIRPLVDEGFFEMRVDNKTGAEAAFRKALDLEPTSRQALFGLGTVLIAAEKYAEAVDVLQRALKNDPNDYFAKNNLAWLHATAKDISFRDGRKAVLLAQDALLIAPLDYHVWSTLAESYYISGKYDKATRSAEEALRLAKASGIDPAAVADYGNQVERCRNAAKAMDILE